MNCVCGKATEVYDSRHLPDDTIMRRRRCKACGKKFVTTELRNEEVAQIRKAAFNIVKLKEEIFHMAKEIADIESRIPTMDQIFSVRKSISVREVEPDHSSP